MNNLNCIRFRFDLKLKPMLKHLLCVFIHIIENTISQARSITAIDGPSSWYLLRVSNEVRLMNARWTDAKSCPLCRLVTSYRHLTPPMAVQVCVCLPHALPTGCTASDWNRNCSFRLLSVVFYFISLLWPAVRCHQFQRNRLPLSK